MRVSEFKKNINIWNVLSFLIILIILIPSIIIFLSIFLKANENWEYIKTNLLGEYLANTVVVLFFTGIFSVILGTTLAYVVNVFRFPFSKFFKWSLILPLSIPTYIAAYTYSGMLDYTGSVTKLLKAITGKIILIDIMSIPGAIFIFTMFLFPYVYMITNAFFHRQSASFLEVARTLGKSQISIFFKVALPIGRVAIISGLSFVLIEVLNDYGVFSYFGIPSLSIAIFKVWFSLGDIDSAMRLGNYLLIFLVIVFVFEIFLRGRKKFSVSNTKSKSINLIKLKGLKSIIPFAYCLIIFSFSFLIPLIQIIFWVFDSYKSVLDEKFFLLIFNSFAITLICSFIIIIFAVLISNAVRYSKGKFLKIFSKITIMGYSIPASVLAVAVLSLFIFLDRSLRGVYESLGIENKTLVLSTSILMLGFAYIIRFLSIACNSVESGFEKIGNKFSEASRTLGKNSVSTFFKVDLKMISPSIFAGFSLVFIDMLKELPLTLILRPFGFNTLSTKVYEYAHDERIIEASVPGIIIIIVSAISVYYFYNYKNRKEEL